MQVLLANPRGFCAGVDRAIEIVNRALELFGAPVYVRHEVVHNRYVVDDLRNRGAIFIEDLADVPDGATLIFSAHGVSQAVRRDAEARNLFDNPVLATRPNADPEAFKVRRGKIGGFRDHLSADDVAWIDACEAERGCEFTRPAA